jgi:hypothetical protein
VNNGAARSSEGALRSAVVVDLVLDRGLAVEAVAVEQFSVDDRLADAERDEEPIHHHDVASAQPRLGEIVRDGRVGDPSEDIAVVDDVARGIRDDRDGYDTGTHRHIAVDSDGGEQLIWNLRHLSAGVVVTTEPHVAGWIEIPAREELGCREDVSVTIVGDVVDLASRSLHQHSRLDMVCRREDALDRTAAAESSAMLDVGRPRIAERISTERCDMRIRRGEGVWLDMGVGARIGSCILRRHGSRVGKDRGGVAQWQTCIGRGCRAGVVDGGAAVHRHEGDEGERDLADVHANLHLGVTTRCDESEGRSDARCVRQTCQGRS